MGRSSAAEYVLLLFRLLWRRFFYVGSGFLQVLYSLAVQFIDAGFAFALREILGGLFGNSHFFGALSAVGDHGGVKNGLASSLFGEFGGGQVAQLIDQVLYAGVVHGLT